MEIQRSYYHHTIKNAVMKIFLLLMLTIICSMNAMAQSISKENQDSLRKVFYGKYSYTHSYGWEHIDMGNGQSMEVIPFSDEVTYYELELYRFGSFAREVSSNKNDFPFFHHIDFGTWKMQGDTLFLIVTEIEYENMFSIYPLYQGGLTYCVAVENPVEEKMYLVQGNYFCNYLDWQAHRDFSICYSRREY